MTSTERSALQADLAAYRKLHAIYLRDYKTCCKSAAIATLHHNPDAAKHFVCEGAEALLTVHTLKKTIAELEQGLTA